MNWLNQESTVVPTARPGKQNITISKVEDMSDEKGNRVLVTFTTDNGAEVTRMFFEQSMLAANIKEMDSNYNNMLKQLGNPDGTKVIISEVLKEGNTFYSNLNYGLTKEGFSTLYVNILSYTKENDKTSEELSLD